MKAATWGWTAKRLTVESVGVVALFAVLRIYATAGSPLSYSDTGTYEILDFFGGTIRLWTVPLFYTLFHGDAVREIGQIVIGIAAWSTLALTVRAIVPDRLVGRAGMVAVLLLGLAPQVTGWDRVMLSESLSTSLLVVLVALLLRLSRAATPRLLAATVAATTLLVFTRQSNALLLISVLPILLLLCFRGLPRKRGAWTAAALIVVAGWAGYATSRDQSVWKWNALQIIENRIAPDPSALRFFADRGLPMDPAIQKERGNFKGSFSPLWRDAALMNWVDQRYKATYVAYLIAHPLHTLRQPFDEAQPGLSGAATDTGPQRPVLPPPLQQTIWATAPGDLVFWMVVAGVTTAAALRRGLRLRPLWVPILLLLIALVGAYLTSHLSGYRSGPELVRLLMPVAVTLRIALVLLMVAAVATLRGPASRGRPRPYATSRA